MKISTEELFKEERISPEIKKEKLETLILANYNNEEIRNKIRGLNSELEKESYQLNISHNIDDALNKILPLDRTRVKITYLAKSKKIDIPRTTKRYDLVIICELVQRGHSLYNIIKGDYRIAETPILILTYTDRDYIMSRYNSHLTNPKYILNLPCDNKVIMNRIKEIINNKS